MHLSDECSVFFVHRVELVVHSWSFGRQCVGAFKLLSILDDIVIVHSSSQIKSGENHASITTFAQNNGTLSLPSSLFIVETID